MKGEPSAAMDAGLCRLDKGEQLVQKHGLGDGVTVNY